MNRQRAIISALAFVPVAVLVIGLSQVQSAQTQEALPPMAPQAVSASSCAAIEIPLHMGDPFAIAYNPVNDYIYVLRTGASAPQAAILRYGREVARIDFPSGGFRELTSVGVNPISGLTYVTQWNSDMVYFIDGALKVGSYYTSSWGPAGVWPSPLTNDTYVSGKWYDDLQPNMNKVVHFEGTMFKGSVRVGPNADPNAGVVAENNQYLYLANSNLNTVSVITASTLVTSINVGNHPNGITYNPVNEYVYVVNRGTATVSSTVSVISGTTVVAIVTLGPGYNDYLGVHHKNAITFYGNIYLGGTDIATVDPTTGYVYVSNWGANTVSVISGTALLATLPVGLHPNSIVYNPVTGLVYVANTGDDTVMVISGTSVVKTVPVGDYPIDLAVDTQYGFVYAINRYSDTLSIIRCENEQPEKRVMGHYMTWYKTPNTYGGPGCSNPEARGEWRMWDACEHAPDDITGTHGFRDIAAVHYPLIGPYDSADPKVIEYHLLQALAAEVDTFVIDYYGENDSGGVDEASLQVLQRVEDMNAQYGTNFKIALMYDEGALKDLPDPFAKAMTDTAYILRTYASSPAYLWADGKPALFYFPQPVPILSPTQLLTVTRDFSLVYQDFPANYLPVMNGSYAWVKGDPWMPDGSNWGEPYLRWWYPELNFRASTVPTLTFGVGAVWGGFDDRGVGEGWSCNGHRWIDRQGGQVYDWTWDILNDYNSAVGITYTLPVGWVQLVTLNDYMEGTSLLASVEVTGVDGVDYGYGYGYQYVQKTEDHAQEFKALPVDARLDIYIAQHIYNARWASRVISNTSLISSALDAFHSGYYTTAMTLADQASGIPAPGNIQATRAADVITVSWQDQPGAALVSGHRVYYGLESGKYISSTVVLSGSSATLHGIAPSAAYYIAVTTLGATQPCETWYVSESWYSDEAVILNSPPAANDDTYTTTEDTALITPALGVLSNDTDMEGDTLTAVKDSDPTHGTVALNGNGSFIYTPTLNYNGLDSFTYHASDSVATSNVATVTISITATNDAPVLDPIGGKNINEQSLLAFTASASDVDLDTLTFSLDAGAPTDASITPGGVFTWTPTEAQGPGVYTVTVRVTDNGTPTLDDFETITITVAEVNTAPVLDPIGDREINELVTLVFTATATDSDIPTQTLSYSLDAGSVGSITPGGEFTWTPTEAQGPGVYTVTVCVTDDGAPNLDDFETIQITVGEVNIAPTAVDDAYSILEDTPLSVSAPGTLGNDSDPDIPANTLTASQVVGPSHGDLALGADGSLVYTPALHWNGLVTFTYTASDGLATSNLATVLITVTAVNDAPAFVSTPTLTATEDVTYTYTVMAEDVDTGDVLTLTAPTLPTWLALTDNGDGIATLSGTPANADVGEHLVTLRVRDTAGLTDTQSFTITVSNINDAPVLAPIGGQWVNELDTLVFTATASDVDSPVLTYTLDASAPANASINPVTGVFTWTPTEAQGPGVYTVTVRVTDNGTPTLDDFETITITVAEINAAPVLDPIGHQSVNVGSLLSFTITASDPDGTTPVLGAANLPAGASFVTATGIFSWTPDYAAERVYTVTFSASDGLLTDTETVSITVNHAPTATAGVDLTVSTNSNVTLDGSSSTDPDPGDTLSYAWQQTGGPDVSFTPNVSKTTFMAPSSATVLTFTLTVTDTGGLADTDMVVVTVRPYTLFLPMMLKNQ